MDMNRRHFNQLLATGALGAGLSCVTLPVFAKGQSTLEKVKASGTLRIGGVADAAPNYQKSVTDGSWKGIFVDISNKLASDLGLKLNISEVTWSGAVLGLEAGKLDVFFALQKTPAREKVINFSGPVINNSYDLVVKDGIQGSTWEDFNKPDITIAVDAGSSFDAAVTHHCPKAHILRLPTQGDATTALLSGRADAQCLVMTLALTLKSKQPSIGHVVVPTPVDYSPSLAGFHRDADMSWQNYVDDWIKKHRENGFIKDVFIKNMSLVGVTPKDFPKGFTI
jgi:polar amino acid transport system substrate-binding protein